MLDQWAGLELRRLLLVALAVDHIGQQRDKLRTRVAMAVDPRPRLAVRRLALFGSRWRQARQRHAVRTGGGSRRDKIRPWMSTVGCPAGTCNRHPKVLTSPENELCVRAGVRACGCTYTGR